MCTPVRWFVHHVSATGWVTHVKYGACLVCGKLAVQGLYTGEFCNIRESTAKMGIKRMTSLIEYSTAWAVGNGVNLREVRYTGDYFGRAA